MLGMPFNSHTNIIPFAWCYDLYYYCYSCVHAVKLSPFLQLFNVFSLSVLSRWPTVVHNHQEHDGGRGAGCVCGGLWLTSAGSEPHVSEWGHVPSQAAGQHPAPAAAGRNGLHPAHCHRQQWVSMHQHKCTYGSWIETCFCLDTHNKTHMLLFFLPFFNISCSHL